MRINTSFGFCAHSGSKFSAAKLYHVNFELANSAIRNHPHAQQFTQAPARHFSLHASSYAESIPASALGATAAQASGETL